MIRVLGLQLRIVFSHLTIKLIGELEELLLGGLFHPLDLVFKNGLLHRELHFELDGLHVLSLDQFCVLLV